MISGSRQGIFFDRDGILNALIYYADTDEWESPRGPQDFKIIPGALDVLRELQQKGWLLFLVSNQPSYAKGKTSLENLQAVHQELESMLTAAQVSLAGVYYCHHHPHGIVPEYTGLCDCRKPGIGSLLKAKAAYDLDLSACWFVGDQDTDVECGQRAGCHTIQVEYAPSQNKRGHSQPDYRCADLSAITAIIKDPAQISTQP